MPLILLSGYPCSGKTHRASQLAADFGARIAAAAPRSRASRLRVVLVSDHSLGVGRTAYATARDEKQARGLLASALRREVGRDVVVVADAMNYIKGFRYQMYCEAKQARTPSCVIHVGAPASKCREINEARGAGAQSPPDDGAAEAPYEPALLDNLIFRYEEPNGMARWDSPLFTVPFDDEHPPYDAIWAALVGDEDAPATARPNAATVLPKVAASDALYVLEKATQDVVARLSVYVADHQGETGGEVWIGGEGGSEKKVVSLPTGKPVTVGQLQRLRRQFVGFHRAQTGLVEKGRVTDTFVEWLNDEWNGEG